jgi:hypothetical protein
MQAADENASRVPGSKAPDPAGMSPGGSRPAEKQYEFKPNENKVIGGLAWRMHFVGLFLVFMGMIIIGIGVVTAGHVAIRVGPIISGSLTCLVGLWTQRASVSLRNVVTTEGRDISHLIDALDDLRKLYSLQFWLFMLGLLLAATGLTLVWMGRFVEIIG